MDRKTNTIVHQVVEDPGDFSNDENLYVYNVQGWEKRAEPGDIVDIQPIGHPWSELERKEFLIVEIEGIEASQFVGLTECLWDLGSYEKYNPLIFSDWYALVVSKIKDPKELKKLKKDKDILYLSYLDGAKERCRYPRTYFKKRRFNVKTTDLIVLGVDLDLMLDKQIEYSPTVLTPKEVCNDKLNDRYITATDGLKPIKPLSDAELKI